jgi:hypothetical protein
MTRTAGTIGGIASVFCSSAGIVLLVFGGILFVKAGPVSAGTGTGCVDKKPKNCSGGLCPTLTPPRTCQTTSGGSACACL